MTNDSGEVSYQYNQLSQTKSEEHEFSGLSGSYTLSYEYNLAGQLKKITDATNVSIKYRYDLVGRLEEVTGEDTLHGGVSEYASNLGYRAWGALKRMTYGNGYTSATGFNSRMQPKQFEIAGRPAHFGPSSIMKAQVPICRNVQNY